MRLLDAAIADSGLVPVEVEGWYETAFADPIALKSSAREQHRVALLSPFDSLVWERERTERLFGFTFSSGGLRTQGETRARILHDALARRWAPGRPGGPRARREDARGPQAHA